MTNSSFSEETETSKTLTGLFALGEALLEEISGKDYADTLSRWMAHHLAELLEAAKTDDSKNRECAGLVLKLWEHRASLPGANRPLEKYEKLIQGLERLSSDDDFYFLSRDQRMPNSAWLEKAKQIDKGCRAAISICLAKAVREEGLPGDPWMKLSETLEPDLPLKLLRVVIDHAQQVEPEDDDVSRARVDSLISALEELENDIPSLLDTMRNERDLMDDNSSE